MDDPALQLSGNAKVIGSGSAGSVVAGGAIYGVVYDSDQTYFTTLNQNNTIALAKTSLDPNSDLCRTIAWDGSNFGVFYKSVDSQIEFRRATPGGTFAPSAPVVVGGYFTGADINSARLPNHTWFMVGADQHKTSNYAYAFSVTDADVASDAPDLASGDGASGGPPAQHRSVGGQRGAGLVRRGMLSGCNYGTAFPNVGPASSSFPAASIAAGPNGFAVVWSDSNNIYTRTFGPNLCD